MLDETGVALADGTRIEPTAVIAATGYRCALEPMVGHLGVLGERGVPLVHGGRPAAHGLRFVGYDPRPAHLGYLGAEARVAARGIAHELRVPGRRALPALRRPALETRG